MSYRSPEYRPEMKGNGIALLKIDGYLLRPVKNGLIPLVAYLSRAGESPRSSSSSCREPVSSFHLLSSKPTNRHPWRFPKGHHNLFSSISTSFINPSLSRNTTLLTLLSTSAHHSSTITVTPHSTPYKVE